MVQVLLSREISQDMALLHEEDDGSLDSKINVLSFELYA